MLLSIRRGATTLAFKILIAFFIVALILLFSLGDYIGSFAGGNNHQDPVVIKAAGTNITERQLAGQIVNYSNTFGQIYDTKFDTVEKIKENNIHEFAQNALLSNQIASKEQERLQLRTSSDAVAATIAADTRFRNSDGNFSETLYTGQLGIQGHNNTSYRAALERQANQTALASAMTFAPEFLPTALTEPLVNYRLQERKFETVLVDSKLVDEPKPTEDELKAHLSENQERFRVPELRKVSAIIIDPADLSDRVTVTDTQLTERFERNKKANRYSSEERRNVQQIVFDSEEQAKEALAALAEKATLADLGTATGRAVSDLGDVPKRQMDATLAAVAFDLEEKTVSDVVKTDFGWHVLSVSGITAAKEQGFEDVKEDIQKTLTEESTRFMAEELSIELDNKVGEGLSLEEIATELGVGLKTFDPISSFGITGDRKIQDDLPREGKFLGEVFKTAAKENSLLGTLEDERYFVLRVDEIIEPRDQSFEEAKRSLENIVKRQQWSDALLAKSKELVGQISEGKTFAAVAEDLGVEIVESEFASRTSISSSKTSERYLGGEVFDAPTKEKIIAAPAGRDYILARLVDVRDVADQDPEESQKAVTGFISQIQSELNQQYQAKLRDLTDVSTNPEALERAVEAAARAIARQ
ncbi:MAG: peptidyl-prolyl cis-trans isomerase [Alphaproteobacteria bacterium]